jgi:hypothetical protein
MSDAVIGWNPVYQPVGTLVGKMLKTCPLSSLGTGVAAVRSLTHARGVADQQTSICKSLHAWLAPRAKTLPRVSTTDAKDVTALFFKMLLVTREVTEGLGLAHCLHYLFSPGHGIFSNGLVQFGFDGASSAQPEGFQSPRGRDCASAPQVDHAGVRCGVAFPRSSGWQYPTRTEVARV